MQLPLVPCGNTNTAYKSLKAMDGIWFQTIGPRFAPIKHIL